MSRCYFVRLLLKKQSTFIIICQTEIKYVLKDKEGSKTKTKKHLANLALPVRWISSQYFVDLHMGSYLCFVFLFSKLESYDMYVCTLWFSSQPFSLDYIVSIFLQGNILQNPTAEFSVLWLYHEWAAHPLPPSAPDLCCPLSQPQQERSVPSASTRLPTPALSPAATHTSAAAVPGGSSGTRPNAPCVAGRLRRWPRLGTLLLWALA